MTQTKQFAIEVPVETYEQLGELDSDRLDEVMVDAVEEALDTVDSAESKREDLRDKMGTETRDSEELVDGSLTDIEAKQKNLRDKITGGR